jgi:hypothetical protein
MERRGINYDVGTRYGEIMTRPEFDRAATRRDLGVIKNDLGCNAVRISGEDPGRLTAGARDALRQGLEVWLSPLLHDKSEQETLETTIACAAAAEELRQQWPRLVFVLGCELTVFMPGLLATGGGNVLDRFASPGFREQLLTGQHNKPLNAFLARANDAVRGAFHGQVTYASAPFEAVDWTLFDFVCLDYYPAQMDPLVQQPYFAHGKPVVITEVGCCTYQGAEDRGGMGWSIIDQSSTPVQELDGSYTRDESLQARVLTASLARLDSAGANGCFVYTFIIPVLTHSEDPRKDLDMASYSLVKSLASGQGTTYPGTSWEPKESFTAVAGYFAQSGDLAG